uniref:RxLR effector candidate protein n=1 Tax=Peronospora matthiolae TaxID=2874970 RepID=A0AAV1V1Q3_9STRA
MHFHCALVQFVTIILATVHAVLQHGQLGSPHPNSGNGPVKTQAPEVDNDDGERGGANLLLHIVKESASNSMPRVLSRIWTGKREPLEDVSASFRLEELRAFESLKHRPWENDMEFDNKRKKRVAIMKTLTKRYGDEAMASRIIELKGVKHKSIRRLALQAQSTQVYIWKEDRRLSKDVFRFLELNKAHESKTEQPTIQEDVVRLFSNAEFETWTNYVHGYYGDDDLKAEITMVMILTSSYGNDRLSKILSTAARTEETETEAVRLQEALFNFWLNVRVDPVQVRTWMNVEGQEMTKREMALLHRYNQDYRNAYSLSLVKCGQAHVPAHPRKTKVRNKSSSLSKL